jgi:transcriptional regulator with XRE-family HTH domain
MATPFSKRMIELRRKKGITQKQAALSLGISQALLSHYENGVRECGLDFLSKAASFYEVSCDYLLGREKKESKTLTPAMKEKKRLMAAERILFDLLERADSPQLMEQASDFLSLAYYRLYRLIYCGGHPQKGEFKIPDYTYRALTDAAMQITEMQLACVLEGKDVGRWQGIDPQGLMTDKATLTSRYGNDFLQLQQLVKKAEKQLNDMELT